MRSTRLTRLQHLEQGSIPPRPRYTGEHVRERPVPDMSVCGQLLEGGDIKLVHPSE